MICKRLAIKVSLSFCLPGSAFRGPAGMYFARFGLNNQPKHRIAMKRIILLIACLTMTGSLFAQSPEKGWPHRQDREKISIDPNGQDITIDRNSFTGKQKPTRHGVSSCPVLQLRHMRSCSSTGLTKEASARLSWAAQPLQVAWASEFPFGSKAGRIWTGCWMTMQSGTAPDPMPHPFPPVRRETV